MFGLARFRHTRAALSRCASASFLLALAAAAAGQSARGEASSENIAIKAIAEVETKSSVNGRDLTKLRPADRVVPGDQVIYTLEIRNTGAMALPPPRVDYPVPDHMRYIADSAAGPGAAVSYSIDGGRTFDRPENLRVAGSRGEQRAATAADYTHIRWQLKNILKGNSVAFARFRAVVK
jgi:uncharacterized repeat protein (TIGR01451 family)